MKFTVICGCSEKMQVFEIPMHHVRLCTSLLSERREISREQILLPMESVIEKGGAFLSIPILSIYVATYNHEQYIVQALDSILMQETKYSYEVLVGEDCSTDNTRAVLKAYEQQHPGRFTIFYRDHNMHREPVRNGMDLKLRCRGKYIIALEGDDYWTDPHKIEKQIDFLESHPEYIAVSHNCMVVDHESRPKDEMYPECKEETYTFHHYVSDILPGQLTTVMYRNIFVDPQYDISLLHKGLTPGDRATYFWLLVNGKIHCMQECMSAYRHVTDRGSSYSATCRYCFEDYHMLYSSMLQYARKRNHSQGIRFARHLLFRNLLQGFKEGQCTESDFRKRFDEVDCKLYVLMEYVIYRIRRYTLRLKFWL